jgi:hypothetical protein
MPDYLHPAMETHSGSFAQAGCDQDEFAGPDWQNRRVAPRRTAEGGSSYLLLQYIFTIYFVSVTGKV